MRIRAQGLALTVAALLIGVTQAHASFITYICNDQACTGGDDIIIQDQASGDNFPGSQVNGEISAGAINFDGFTIIADTSVSKPVIGSSQWPQLDITFSAVTSDNSSHQVFIYASDTDFTGDGIFDLSLGGTQPGSNAGAVTASAFGANSNNNLDLSALLATLGPTSVSPFALSSIGSLLPTDNPYSLTIGVEITRTGAGATTGDLNLTSEAPEPTALVFACLGTVGLLVGRARLCKPAQR